MFNKNQRIIAFLLLIVLTVLLFPHKGYAQDIKSAPFQIDFIDVGQGDAALVKCDGHYMLIDGGSASKSSLIYSYLKSRSIKNIDVMVATHPDEDHIGGLSGALNYANVGLALCPVTQHSTKTFQSFVKYLGAQGRTITVPKAGQYFMLGSAVVYILGPTYISDEANNNSIVLRIVYGKASFLFTGDAETEEENAILNSGQAVQSTVLKVAHHGSDSSTGYQFLRAVAPKYAVISVGSENSYGHPTENTLSRLRDAGAQVLRTDLQGDIVCTTDGNYITFYVQRNANINTLANAGPGQNQDLSYLTPSGNSAPDNQAGIPDRYVSDAGNNQSAQSYSYVLNTNSHNFHRPECSSVNDMKEKNKQYFNGSREEAIALGYEPCKRCNP
ncbi:MAG: MBL fold metallo-hydrolase [Lachnospiraceae bacterium]|nr:MBL fold metallo-hydrolase [Lachnospiraceae bacterium]